MDSNIKYPDTLLKKYQKTFEKDSITTGWGEATEAAPYEELLVRFDEIGDRNLSIVFELCFLPLTEMAEQGVHILQTFVVVAEKIPSSTYAELLKAAARINTQLPLGAFGLFEDTGVLYFKYNSMLLKSEDEDTAVLLIDRQCGLILHQLLLFIDRLLEVAEGKKSALDALKNAPLV